MSTALHFDLKKTMPVLNKDNRLNVLIFLVLSANTRNRCWPGMDLIAARATNKNLEMATRAKNWLIEHGAIELVPYEKRWDGEEKALPRRQHIYQLTGVLVLEGQITSYLHVGKTDVSPRETSPGEISAGGNQSISTIEDVSIEEVTTTVGVPSGTEDNLPLSSSSNDSGWAKDSPVPEERETAPNPQFVAPPPSPSDKAVRAELWKLVCERSFYIPYENGETKVAKGLAGRIGKIASGLMDMGITPQMLEGFYDYWGKHRTSLTIPRGETTLIAAVLEFTKSQRAGSLSVAQWTEESHPSDMEIRAMPSWTDYREAYRALTGQAVWRVYQVNWHDVVRLLVGSVHDPRVSEWRERIEELSKGEKENECRIILRS